MAGADDQDNALELWRSFPHDPRDPSHAALRASDVDRDRIHQVLVTAYAEGRLDRAEFDERTEVVARARTLGELPAVVGDLLPDPGPALSPAARWLPTGIPEQALAAYRSERQQAVWGALSASVICWVIWWVTGHGFPWPVFVMLGTGMNALRVVFFRQSLIAEEAQRLQRQAEKRRLKESRKRELPPGGEG